MTQGDPGLFSSCLPRCVFRSSLGSLVSPHWSQSGLQQLPFPTSVSLQNSLPLPGIHSPTFNIQPKGKGSIECATETGSSESIFPCSATWPSRLCTILTMSLTLSPLLPRTLEALGLCPAYVLLVCTFFKIKIHLFKKSL